MSIKTIEYPTRKEYIFVKCVYSKLYSLIVLLSLFVIGSLEQKNSLCFFFYLEISILLNNKTHLMHDVCQGKTIFITTTSIWFLSNCKRKDCTKKAGCHFI